MARREAAMELSPWISIVTLQRWSRPYNPLWPTSARPAFKCNVSRSTLTRRRWLPKPPEAKHGRESGRRGRLERAAISRLENGIQVNPTVDTLYRYASAVGAEIGFTVRVG